MDHYVTLAKELNMLNAIIISPADLCFDKRAILKCHWGCEDFFKKSIKCHHRDTTYFDRMEMIKNYKHILIAHSHSARELSIALLKLERMAFLDGHYFAFAICVCNLCSSCHVEQGEPCPTPHRVRPCDQMCGIDVYKTARNLNMPCEVLQNKGEIQNRYGFLLID